MKKIFYIDTETGQYHYDIYRYFEYDFNGTCLTAPRIFTTIKNAEDYARQVLTKLGFTNIKSDYRVEEWSYSDSHCRRILYLKDEENNYQEILSIWEVPVNDFTEPEEG